MPEATTVAMQELLGRFQTGDSSAKKALVERAYSRLIALARSHLRNFPTVRNKEETEAVLGLAYEKITRALEDVRPSQPREFFALASQQIRWLLLDLKRGEVGRGKVARPKQVGGVGAPDDEGGEAIDPGETATGVRQSEIHDDILEALERLPENLREVVEMMFFHDLTQVEAAEILGVHKDTVKRAWATARVELAEFLSDYQHTG